MPAYKFEALTAAGKTTTFQYLTKPWNEEELDMAIVRANDVYEKKISEKELTNKLALTNDQLEFLLRQKLLS